MYVPWFIVGSVHRMAFVNSPNTDAFQFAVPCGDKSAACNSEYMKLNSDLKSSNI